MGTASLSAGLTLLFLEESLPFSIGGGGGSLSSLSPATEGEEAGDMGGKEGGEAEDGSGKEGGEAEDMGVKVAEEVATASLSAGLTLLVEESLCKEGGEAEDVGVKVAEEVATTSLSAGLILLVEESLLLFCAGGGDPLSSLLPAADSTEAGNMVGKEAEDVSCASSVRPRMAKREVPSLVVFPLPPPAPVTAGGGDAVSLPPIPATKHGDCLPSTLPGLSRLIGLCVYQSPYL